MIADYVETYQPGCPVEKDLVAEMVAPAAGASCDSV
jgi:hypothetical protein